MRVHGSIRALSVFPFTICPWLGTRVLCGQGIDRWSKVRRTAQVHVCDHRIERYGLGQMKLFEQRQLEPAFDPALEIF